ncbi:MAG: hypothetical protein ACHQQQ_12330 [Bacteroidota bacterium]
MTRINKIASLFIVILQLCVVFLPDAGHDEAILGGIGAIQQFITHDCGAHERHKPIDPNHVCQACYRQVNSTANTAPTIISFTVGSISPEYISPVDFSPTRSSEYYASTPKRGPPSSILI